MKRLPAAHAAHPQSGQTLLEVMIALAVLTAGFLGIFTLLAQSIHLSKDVSNSTTATYLAEEGIELAKNIIDHEVYQHLDPKIGGPGWGTAFGGGGSFELDHTTCTSLPSQASLCTSLPAYTGQTLGYDPTTHLFSYGGPIATPFTRLIRVIVPTGGPPEITVQSIVSWPAGFGTQSVTLEDHFYNWHP